MADTEYAMGAEVPASFENSKATPATAGAEQTWHRLQPSQTLLKSEEVERSWLCSAASPACSCFCEACVVFPSSQSGMAIACIFCSGRPAIRMNTASFRQKPSILAWIVIQKRFWWQLVARQVRRTKVPRCPNQNEQALLQRCAYPRRPQCGLIRSATGAAIRQFAINDDGRNTANAVLPGFLRDFRLVHVEDLDFA